MSERTTLRFGYSPLDDATRHKRVECQKLLRGQGSTVGSGSDMGMEMAKAGAAGDRKRVAQLLYAGVQPLARDRMGRTVLHTAAANGAVAVLDYVLNGPSSAKGNPLGDKNGGGGGQGDPPKEMFETGKSYVGGGRDSGGGGSAWGSQSQLAVVDAAAAAAATAANARLARTLDVNPIDARGHTPLDEALRTGQEVATVMLRMRGGLAAGDPGYKEVQERGSKAGPSIRFARVDYSLGLRRLICEGECVFLIGGER